MRERELKRDKNDLAETAVIRRIRERRRLHVETAETLLFNAAAYRLDRELGIPENIAVENNLTIRPKWPEIIYE